MADGADTLLERFLAWFPSGKDDAKGWRFDVITLLAIIGEGSVAEHAQTISASSLCLLPRIIPAPQALLKPSRPQRLPEVTAKMAGVYGGVVLDTVGFFANIIHPLEDLKPFAFRVLEIKHKHIDEPPQTPQSPGWKKLPFGRGRPIKRNATNKKSHASEGVPSRPPGTGMGSSVLLASVRENKEMPDDHDTEQEKRLSARRRSRSRSPRPPPPFSQTTTLTSDLLTHDNDKKPSLSVPDPTAINNGHPVTVTVTAKHKDELTPITPTSVSDHPPISHSQVRSRPQTTPLQTNTDLLHPSRPRKTTTFSQQLPSPGPGALEKGQPLLRRATLAEKFTDMVTNPTMANSQDRYTVPPTLYSPLHIISILSFFLTVALVTCSTLWHDGTAIVAIILISLASSVVGYASYWRPLLMSRRTTNKVPKGDVVIRTREGAFVLIKCTEEVARELYSGTEECQYVVSTKFYRAFMGLGMVLLMISVVLLGNCGWESQAFIGASYIFLNGIYWALGLLPHRYFWDLSRYKCVDVTPEDALNADKTTSEDPREGTPSFTRTLWYAIRETKHGAWVDRSGALPGTEQWRRWRDEAVKAAKRGDREWKAVGRKNEIMKEELVEVLREMEEEMGMEIGEAERREMGMEVEVEEMVDLAEQKAPLVQVQGPARANTFGM